MQADLRGQAAMGAEAADQQQRRITGALAGDLGRAACCAWRPTPDTCPAGARTSRASRRLSPGLSNAGSTRRATSTGALSRTSRMPSLMRWSCWARRATSSREDLPVLAGETIAQGLRGRGRGLDAIHQGEARQGLMPIGPAPEVGRLHRLGEARSWLLPLRRKQLCVDGRAFILQRPDLRRGAARRQDHGGQCRRLARAGCRCRAGGARQSLSGSTNSAWMARPSLRTNTN